MRTTDRALVIAAVASFTLALSLRLWNLPAELPFHYEARESIAYEAAIGMVSEGTLDPRPDDPFWFDDSHPGVVPDLRVWPSGLSYLELAPVVVIHAVADAPLERLRGPGYSPGMIPEAQVGYLLGGRLLMALLGALAAAVTVLAARRFSNGLVAPLTAGFIVAVLPAHVDLSQRLLPEAPATLGIALALLGAVSLARGGGRPGHLILAGAAVGLAAAFRYAAGLVGLTVVAAILTQPGKGRGRRLAELGLAGIGAVAAFAALSWPSLMAPQATWASLSLSPGPSGPLAALTRLAEPAVVGPGVLALAALSISAWLTPRTRSREGRAVAVVLAVVVAWLLLLAWHGPSASEGAAALFAPALGLLTAATVAIAARLLRRRPLVTLFYVAVALALLPTALAGGTAAWTKGLPRTETLAHDWFVSAVPPDAHVLRDASGPQLSPQRFDVVSAPNAGSTLWLQSLRADSDLLVVSSVTLAAVERGDTGESGRRFLDDLFARRPAVAFCPIARRLIGPEIWVFPQSDRARRQFSEFQSVGRCRYDRPWMPGGE